MSVLIRIQTDTIIVFLKDVDFESNLQMTKKYAKLPNTVALY